MVHLFSNKYKFIKMKIFLNIIILFLLIYSDLIFAKTKLNLENILNETQKQEHLIDEFKKHRNCEIRLALKRIQLRCLP